MSDVIHYFDVHGQHCEGCTGCEIERLTAEVERVKDASLNDIERLMSRVENLKHVLAALIVRLDMVTEDTAGIWGYLADHNMEYSGANYGKELEAARRALDGEE